MSRLGELLAPMPPGAYFRDDWEKRLCLVARDGSICGALPLGFLSGAGGESMTDRLRWRVEVLLASDSVCEAAARLWKRLLRLSADGHFASRCQISAIIPETWLRKRVGVVCTLESKEQARGLAVRLVTEGLQAPCANEAAGQACNATGE